MIWRTLQNNSQFNLNWFSEVSHQKAHTQTGSKN
jgi:hypothetical protein